MKDSRRVCYTCGKKYHYCSHCPEYKNKPEWMNITCCEECHDLYVVCANFNLGKCSKEEAQALLSKYDLSQISISRPNMIHTLQKIYDKEEVDTEIETPVVIQGSAVEEEVPEDNDENSKEEAVEEKVSVESENDVESKESAETEQPKTRRHNRTKVVLDELDE